MNTHNIKNILTLVSDYQLYQITKVIIVTEVISPERFEFGPLAGCYQQTWLDEGFNVMNIQ